MSSYLLLMLISCITVRSLATDCLRAADKHYYRREVLLEDKNIERGGLAIHWKSNKLYVTLLSDDLRFYINELDIDNGTYTTIGELPYFCRLTVDQRRGDLYAGCDTFKNSGGLYVYNDQLHRFEYFKESIEFAYYIHFSGVLYYTDFPESKLHSCVNDHCQTVLELEHQNVSSFVVNGRGDRVFTYLNNAYYQEVGTTAVIGIATKDQIRQVAVDPNGEVYGYSSDTIVHINTNDTSVSKVLDLSVDLCMRLNFDRDGNFVFMNWYNKQIVRFVRCEP